MRGTRRLVYARNVEQIKPLLTGCGVRNVLRRMQKARISTEK